MPDRDLDLRLLTARAVAAEAGKLAYDYFKRRGQLEIERKGMQDLVSVADRAVEDLIRERLGSAFPEDDLLGEEGGGAERRPGAGLWVIDPIDGTANFLRGMPYWSVALAYVVEDRVRIGVTYDPVHDELFWARRGGGAYRNHTPIRVSGRTDPQQTVVGSTFTFKMNKDAYMSLIQGFLLAGSDHRRMGSTALMMCHVADGRLDGCAMAFEELQDLHLPRKLDQEFFIPLQMVNLERIAARELAHRFDTLPIGDRHEFGLVLEILAKRLHAQCHVDERLDAGFVIVDLVLVGA